jgi:inorganic pyrophosphatase
MELNKLEPGEPNKVNVLITSEKDSRDFCEYDENSEAFILRKVLTDSFPYFYGFIPKTHHTDGEPLDVLVLTDEPIKQGVMIQARPIGLIRLRGKIQDDILIAILLTDKKFEKIQDLLSIDENEIERLKSFLAELKGKEFENIFGPVHARKAVEHSIELYKREFE